MTAHNGPAIIALAAAACATPAMAAPLTLLTSHVQPVVAAGRAAPVAPLPPATPLRLTVALPLREVASLNALLHALYDPASPRYRRFLSVTAFTARFGPTVDDYAAAVRFFSNRGLRVTATTPNRFLIDIAGTAADIERVFQVRLNLYRHTRENRLFFAPDREPALDLAVPIMHVTGLDNYAPPTPRLVRGNQDSTPSTGHTGSGPNGDFIGTDMRAAYYPGGALSGAGQSLGLMELAGYEMYDVRNFFRRFGPANNVRVTGISVDGASLGCLFHDMTKGQSGRFRCTPSYDLVTGLGTPPGQNLIDAIVQASDPLPK